MQKSELNILIVEDDVTQREALSEAIKRRGYRAVPVAKPDEAESLAKVKPIHGLVIDCMLPGRNGVDVAVRLRENLVEGAVIIFVSGIYKDKGFAQEALKRAEGNEFLTKPFDMEALLNVIDKTLSVFIEKPKVDLHALLAAPSASARERKKALDHVEEMFGFDLPFVLCILMDSESSGHLNIVDADQNIFGVSIAKGAILKVDSEKTALMTKKLLIHHGFITELDLSEYTAKKKTGDLIRNLIGEGLMSPHVVNLIKKEQITTELAKLIDGRKLRINFVPDRKLKDDASAIDIMAFMNDLHDQVKSIPLEYLKQFYSVWAGHPIRLGPNYQDQIQFLGLPMIKGCDGLLEAFKKNLPLEDLLASATYGEDLFYHALHFLAIRRVIVFEEARLVRNLDEHVSRLKTMHAALKDKGPLEIFQYFGLSGDPKPADVSRIYREFAKSNHPDTLPQAISPEHSKLNHELFAWVTSAADILGNDEKRKKYLDSLKQKDAEVQLRAEDHAAEAKALMTRGKYREALTKLEEARALMKTDLIELQYIWACYKVPGKVQKEDIVGFEKTFFGVAPETKKTAIYSYVSGLLKKADGRNAEAYEDFAKAFKLDKEFADARRDMIEMKAAQPKPMTANELFTGDITAVLGNFMKKKKSG